MYLKKLSTGWEEYTSHKKLLEELDTRIETFKETEKNKKTELIRLEEDKRRFKEEQDREINNLKETLIRITKEEEDRKIELKAKEQREKEEANAKHEMKLKTLDAKVKEAEKELLDTESKNKTAQTNQLKALVTFREQTYVAQVSGYDTDMNNEKKDLEDKRQMHDEIQAKLAKIEDEYRRVKHEKEINQAIDTEWQIKIQVYKGLTIEI